MIGFDALDMRVFNQCVGHKSPEGDLQGDQLFTLAGMELTLDWDIIRSKHPIQFIETMQASKNSTLSTTGIGWNVKTPINWFDKTIDITKLKGKPIPIFGRKMKNLREA